MASAGDDTIHPMALLRLAAAIVLLCSCLVEAQQYYPGTLDNWERRAPAQAGFDPKLLDEAIALAKKSETWVPRDLELSHYLTFGREPYGEATGPFKPRGDVTGIILRGGYVVAEWGEPERVDLTFSATKSFVSSVVGLAVDRGLIGSVNDRVGRYVTTGEFDSPHNAKITWDHLLRQTSDWEGTLWGKPDWADRPPKDKPLLDYKNRARNEPGSTYQYNDTRVNLLALAALHVWRRPLPQVAKEFVMDPIGASNTWRWYGYKDSWVNMDGVMVQSVSGGAHFGGGMWISARDMARFGLLTLRRGQWKDRRILSEGWVKMALTPTGPQPTYGFMNWFLNTDRKLWPSAPASSFAHIGAGRNMIYCDPQHDLVVVLRWIEDKATDEILKRVFAAINRRDSSQNSNPR